MIEKIVDAGSMLWLNLDTRERAIVLYAVAVGLVVVADLMSRGERERHDEQIARRAAQLVREGR